MPRPCFLCCASLLILSTPQFARAEPITEVRFSGELSQDAPGGSRLLRQFEVLLLDSTAVQFFAVLDDPGEGCPWPESFGQVNAPNGPTPHLLYEYDDSQYNISVPPLVVDLPDDADSGSSWKSGGWTYQVTDSENVDGTRAWKVQARERRGRRQSLLIAADSGILLKAEQEVFMGQGQRFQLTVGQTSATKIDEDKSDRVGQLQSKLMELQAALNRRPDSQLKELSQRQVTDAVARIPALTELADGTALEESVLRIRRDVERQQRRVTEAMSRGEALLDRAAPQFTLNLVNGETLSADALKGKIIVLHFWKYADKPLSEPYGQVGYLEFLYNKRKQNGVEVVGIATNAALQRKDTLRSAQRSARKLTEFMNLSYPIGYDDGSLLRSFGDPRDNGGELPLWIVVSAKGLIAHYHGGFYEVDQRLGLKALDDILIEQIRSN